MKNLMRAIETDPDFLRLRPVLAQANGEIYAGNQRYLAAQQLGRDSVWAIVEDIPDRLAKERALRDNGSWGEWTDDLTALLNELKAADADLDLLGFPEPDLERLLAEPKVLNEDDADLTPPAEPITRPGDLWLLGEHRLLCGDATNAEDVARLMDGGNPDMVFSDPPYGISIVSSNGTVGGPNLAPIGIYPAVRGDETTETAEAAARIALNLWPRAAHVWWGANHYATVFPASPCWLVWDKENGANNFADAELAWTNRPTAVRIFRHMWQGMLRDSERSEKRVHPTQKPVALACWVYETYGAATDLILDPFLGSGTTLIAAEQLDRRCYAMEIEPAYVDVSVRRWETVTGRKAVLDGEAALVQAHA
jgi:hypothetical protein